MANDSRGYLLALTTARSTQRAIPTIAAAVVHGSKSERDTSISCSSVSLEGMG
ncbi:MAG: hypothetical protein A4E67_02414 [Syntrophaceae bacterium PtaB.Bin038]|nr:MAG: hypothetical protein A4E67_02414 [Syntrophaceae bacterium PtaB.Bin038]